MYDCQFSKLSGMADMPITAMIVYAAAAKMIAAKIIPFDFLTGNLKLSVSNDMTSNPTNAHGARKTILNIP